MFISFLQLRRYFHNLCKICLGKSEKSFKRCPQNIVTEEKKLPSVITCDYLPSVLGITQATADQIYSFIPYTFFFLVFQKSAICLTNLEVEYYWWACFHNIQLIPVSSNWVPLMCLHPYRNVQVDSNMEIR